MIRMQKYVPKNAAVYGSVACTHRCFFCRMHVFCARWQLYRRDGDTSTRCVNRIERSTGACGGDLACSTCHVVLPKEYYDKLDEKEEEEDDMLDLAWGLTDT